MPPRSMDGTLAVTGNDEFDALVNSDPNALLIAMLLDQQIPLAWAFSGPARLQQRLGHLDPSAIAEMSLDELTEAVSEKPALHRFPAATAKRLHDLMRHLDEHYTADAARLWDGARDAEELFNRLRELPGFGEEKSQITIAVLAKRFGIAPTGWTDAAGVFADDEPRSAADAFDPDSMAAVKAWKAAQKAAGLDKQGRALGGK